MDGHDNVRQVSQVVTHMLDDVVQSAVEGRHVVL